MVFLLSVKDKLLLTVCIRSPCILPKPEVFRKKNFFHPSTVVCFASKTDIPYNQAKMKVKKLTFFMTYQLVLDPGGSTKLNLLLWNSYSLCYDPQKIGDYPKIIWKMAIF